MTLRQILTGCILGSGAVFSVPSASLSVSKHFFLTGEARDVRTCEDVARASASGASAKGPSGSGCNASARGVAIAAVARTGRGAAEESMAASGGCRLSMEVEEAASDNR